MPTQYQAHPLLTARNAHMRQKRRKLHNKTTFKNYLQIIRPHYSLHAQIVISKDGHETENLKIHISPTTKIAHAFKKHGLPDYIRKRDLGNFSQCLDRTLDSLEACGGV